MRIHRAAGRDPKFAPAESSEILDGRAESRLQHLQGCRAHPFLPGPSSAAEIGTNLTRSPGCKRKTPAVPAPGFHMLQSKSFTEVRPIRFQPPGPARG